MHNRNGVIDSRITPEGRMDVLSKSEVLRLLDASEGELHTIFRNCSLAVLNCGSHIDNGKELLEKYATFDIRVIPQERGIKLELKNAPASAFVDGKLIQGINDHLFAVLRDVIFLQDEVYSNSCKYNLNTSAGITDAVFQILRHARILRPRIVPNLVVCWGGHSIKHEEYKYTGEVGHAMGLRGLDICTGCGPGAMKGPMKGATIAHAKQRIRSGLYIGMTEPGIIAAEPPNPIVNDLVILPDIEKRLEAFIRTGHGVVVFPGGPGTAEEILYILGVLLHPDNKELPFPLIFTGPESSRDYFKGINNFIGDTLGLEAQQRYKIIIGDPDSVAREMKAGIEKVYEFRKATSDAFYYNWLLKIDEVFQHPFDPTHENMAALELHKNQERHHLAANLRKAFSGIVSGNVKDEGVRLIEAKGPFELKGDPDIMESMDRMLAGFVAQGRMKLSGEYTPCYRIHK